MSCPSLTVSFLLLYSLSFSQFSLSSFDFPLAYPPAWPSLLPAVYFILSPTSPSFSLLFLSLSLSTVLSGPSGSN